MTGAGRGIGRGRSPSTGPGPARRWRSPPAPSPSSTRVAAEITAGGGRALGGAHRRHRPRRGDGAASRAPPTTLGGVDLVLANAGGTFPHGTVADGDYDAWRSTFVLNVDGVYLTARAAVPHLRARGGGKILVMGSGAGSPGRPGLGAVRVGQGRGVDARAGARPGAAGRPHRGQRGHPGPGADRARREGRVPTSGGRRHRRRASPPSGSSSPTTSPASPGSSRPSPTTVPPARPSASSAATSSPRRLASRTRRLVRFARRSRQDEEGRGA